MHDLWMIQMGPYGPVIGEKTPLVMPWTHSPGSHHWIKEPLIQESSEDLGLRILVSCRFPP